MASIWEKAISILAGNLNSGHSYPISAVTDLQGVTAQEQRVFFEG